MLPRATFDSSYAHGYTGLDCSNDIADMALLRTCGTDRGGFFAGRAGGLSGGASGCSNPAFLSRTAELI